MDEFNNDEMAAKQTEQRADMEDDLNLEIDNEYEM